MRFGLERATLAFAAAALFAGGAQALAADPNPPPGQTRVVSAKPVLRAGVRPAPWVDSPPLLIWRRVAGAAYYNVQLYRGEQKILSSWPVRNRLALRSAWSFEGRRHELSPGRYRWYVWPGFGPRSSARYGKPVGASSFVFWAGS